MGQLFENLREIAEDFKTSWYFRIWAATWFVFALVAFIGLIELGARSNESGREKDWNTWIENATELTFPRFHFRIPSVDTQTEKILNFYCSRLPGEIIHTGTCVGHSDTSRCFAVYADEINVQNSITAREGADKITCTFNTTGYNRTENSNIGWSIEGPHSTFSSPFSNTLWLEPRVAPGAWVYLQKRMISSMNNNLFSDNLGHEVWEKSYIYHTTVRDPGSYSVTTLLSTFKVEHREQTDTYNGWMAVGGIGGFAFFMVILHTITMIVFGFFLANESRFLVGGKKP